MKYELVTVKDRAVNAFEAVGCVRHKGEAVRMFHDAIANPEHKYSKHPDDYDLYHVGTFDDQNGQITNQAPEKIADGKTVAEMQKNT